MIRFLKYLLGTLSLIVMSFLILLTIVIVFTLFILIAIFNYKANIDLANDVIERIYGNNNL